MPMVRFFFLNCGMGWLINLAGEAVDAPAPTFAPAPAAALLDRLNVVEAAIAHFSSLVADGEIPLGGTDSIMMMLILSL